MYYNIGCVALIMIQVMFHSGHAPYNSSGAQLKTEVEYRQEYTYVYVLALTHTHTFTSATISSVCYRIIPLSHPSPLTWFWCHLHVNMQWISSCTVHEPD